MHMGERNRLHRGTQLFDFTDGRLNCLMDVRIKPLAKEFFRKADTKSLKAVIKPLAIDLLGPFDAGGVFGVETGHGLKKPGAIFGGFGHRACLIQA